MPLLEVALNGHRTPAEHPAIPRTPAELAREARASVDAGAEVLHVHAYEDGEETFAAEPCAAMLRAIREACPGVPISQTTALYIAGDDPERLLALIVGWTELPELVTANQGEPGIAELCERSTAATSSRAGPFTNDLVTDCYLRGTVGSWDGPARLAVSNLATVCH